MKVCLVAQFWRKITKNISFGIEKQGLNNVFSKKKSFFCYFCCFFDNFALYLPRISVNNHYLYNNNSLN